MTGMCMRELRLHIAWPVLFASRAFSILGADMRGVYDAMHMWASSSGSCSAHFHRVLGPSERCWAGWGASTVLNFDASFHRVQLLRQHSRNCLQGAKKSIMLPRQHYSTPMLYRLLYAYRVAYIIPGYTGYACRV